MHVYLASFVVFLLAILGMAVGVLAGRASIKGSCGGLNRAGVGLPACDVCATPCAAREDASQKVLQRGWLIKRGEAP
jgi:hypothetical protein